MGLSLYQRILDRIFGVKYVANVDVGSSYIMLHDVDGVVMTSVTYEGVLERRGKKLVFDTSREICDRKIGNSFSSGVFQLGDSEYLNSNRVKDARIVTTPKFVTVEFREGELVPSSLAEVLKTLEWMRADGLDSKDHGAP